jgi:hypothetical protein
MGHGSRYKRQRRRMWELDPRCHWCGTETVLPEQLPDDHWRVERKTVAKGSQLLRQLKRPPANLATIDHLRSRYDSTRQEPAQEGERRRVLACYACNNRRNTEEQATLPREELWKRAGNGANETHA